MHFEAYKKANMAVEKPTQTEYRIFAEITRELESAAPDTAEPTARIKAAYRNSQLWLTLKTDLMSEHNKLDKHLKAGLISLAIWVEKESIKAIRGNTDLLPLIEVNKDIMQGLSQSVRPVKKETPAQQTNVAPETRYAMA